jgi:hypothetical protein
MRTCLLAATALAVLCGSAYAQTSNSNSNPVSNGASTSNSGAKATSSTKSASRAAAVGNSTTVNVSGYAGVDNSGSGSGSGGTGVPSGSGGYVEYGGGYTVRNTPEVIAPSIVGGNPCAVGASGGLSLPGFGIALGGTWADRACERRQQAALLFNMGEQKVALELMCQDDNVRTAMKVGGKTCAADAPVAQAPAPVAQAPSPAAPMVLAAAQSPAAPRPAWCAKAAPSTEASKAYVEQACGRL